MSKWLNGRLRGEVDLKHQLFGTEQQAKNALEQTLETHKARGRQIASRIVGGEERWYVTDADGQVAVHWLSDVQAKS